MAWGTCLRKGSSVETLRGDERVDGVDRTRVCVCRMKLGNDFSLNPWACSRISSFPFMDGPMLIWTCLQSWSWVWKRQYRWTSWWNLILVNFSEGRDYGTLSDTHGNVVDAQDTIGKSWEDARVDMEVHVSRDSRGLPLNFKVNTVSGHAGRWSIAYL